MDLDFFERIPLCGMPVDPMGPMGPMVQEARLLALRRALGVGQMGHNDRLMKQGTLQLSQQPCELER